MMVGYYDLIEHGSMAHMFWWCFCWSFFGRIEEKTPVRWKYWIVWTNPKVFVPCMVHWLTETGAFLFVLKWFARSENWTGVKSKLGQFWKCTAKANSWQFTHVPWVGLWPAFPSSKHFQTAFATSKGKIARQRIHSPNITCRKEILV
jgi:hypothetical protein